MPTKISLQHLQLPFKMHFKHASADRTTGDSILAIAEDEDGWRGYGEGCPRSYVTGESWETAQKFFADPSEDIDANPAAYCAMELAKLDLQGKQERKTVEQILGVPNIAGTFQYSAVLGISELAVFTEQLQKYSKMGFGDFKLKLSGDLASDKNRIKAFSEIAGPQACLRLDANNLWNTAAEAILFLKKLPYSAFAIEEPLGRNNYEGLAVIARELNTSIILDESFLRIQQFEELDPGTRWIINLRVSKMGGLDRSLAIALKAQRRRIPIIVGAQVGESSILTRAALTVANAYRENVIAQEGAFGALLLEHDIVAKPLQFGAGGILDSKNYDFSRSGLGLDIIED